MIPSTKAYELIKEYESLKLAAYLDPIGIPTIGWGTIMYDDGRKVKMGDVITKDRADQLLKWEIDNKAKSIDAFTKKVKLTQNQFDSLVSWTYNLGVGNLQKSTMLKKIKANPNDPAIETEMKKWNRAGGKVLNGLTRRRSAESALYFTP